MLYKTKSKRTAMLKYGFCAPLFAGMLIFSAASASNTDSPIAEKANQLIRPVNQILESTPVSIMSVAGNEIDVKDVAKQSLGSRIIETTPPATRTEQNDLKPTAEDLTAFKNYLKRTLRYPAAAREKRATGLIAVKFTISNKKLTTTSIESSQSELLSAEVQRVISTYNDDIDLPNASYTMDFLFQLHGADVVLVDDIERRPSENYKGRVVVIGYVSSPSKSVPPAVLSETAIVSGRDKDIMDFSKVEVLPEFEGGTQGWANYLRTNLKYPATARENNLQGRVILSFVVEKDGDLSDIKVLRGIGGGTDEEAVRVLENSPKWKPGILSGKPVRVAYTMPIFFQLASPEVKKDNN